MGTNYYLRKKATYTPRKDRDEDWYENYDFDFYENDYNEVLELTNGYVFNNTYYMTLEDLNNNYYLIYHIGKKSYGWKFLLSSYLTQNITTLEEWTELFKQQDNKIVDEYGKEITPQEMINIIIGADLDVEQLQNNPSPGLFYSTSSYDVSDH